MLVQVNVEGTFATTDGAHHETTLYTKSGIGMAHSDRTGAKVM